jgi:hypothetical protein
MALNLIRLLFAVAGLYDLLIGLAFVCFGPQIFDAAGVTEPTHSWPYLQFGALLVAIFGIMFLAVAYAPQANRNLILYGLLLKLSYTGVVAYYFFTAVVPMLFVPFAVIDATMFVLFALAYGRLSTNR